MTHLSTTDLLTWRDAPSEADRARIAAHLASCGQCAARCAEVIRTRPMDEPLPPRDLSAFLARGHAIRSGSPASVERLSRRWLIGLAPLAAAAALIAAIVVPLMNRDDEPTVLRGDSAGVTLIRPVGVEVAIDELAFEWRVESGSDRVRLQVFDVSAPGQPILQREVAGSRYDPSAEERGQFPKGRDLYWFVEYRTAQSATLISPAAKFTVK